MTDNTSSCPCEAVKLLQRQMQAAQSDISKLFTSSSVLEVRLDNIERTINEISLKLDRLIAKPNQKWEFIIANIWKAVIAAAVGYLFIVLGLK